MKDFVNLTSEEKEALRKKMQEIFNKNEQRTEEIKTRAKAIKIGFNALPEEICKYHKEFERLTGLTEKDVSFCIFAATLQIARQYLVTYFKDRLKDQAAAKSNPFHTEEHSNRSTRRYYATKEEIVSNPVPFDTIQKEYKIKCSTNNPLINGANHRYKALGHDPILGLIIGTANIMTKTITISKGLGLDSFHVHSGINFINKNETINSYYIDKIDAHASTPLIFEHIFKRLSEEKSRGWEALGYSLVKEVVHLSTDIPTKQSLPIPIISAFSPGIAKTFGNIGLDMANVLQVGAQCTLAMFINWIIASLHKLCYNEKTDVSEELYSVRTKKIIQYSNEIATISNSLIVAVRSYFDQVNSHKYFDLGGALVTLRNSWNTPLEIAKIQHEYILNKTIKYTKEL